MAIGDIVDKLLVSVKGLTLLNAVVIVMLLFAMFPAYVGWKMLNDTNLLSLVMSQYEELPSETDCSLAMGQASGASPTYFVRNVFQERANEVWYAAVKIKFKPDDEAMRKYCASLDTVIEYMREPTKAVEPKFPGSERLLFPPSRGARRQAEAYQQYEDSRNDAFASQEHP